MKAFLKKSSNLLWKSSAQLILVALIIFFGIECKGSFFTVNNLISIVRQVSTMGIAALGISFLMISGNLDFSTGQVYAFVGTLTAWLYSIGINIVLAMLLGLVGGIAIFCLTCWISSQFNISRLVISMAVGTAVSGLSCIIASNKTIYGLPEGIKWLGQGYLFDVIPISMILFFVLALVVAFVLKKTYLGRYLFAVGGSEDVARLSGINVNKIKYVASIIAGLLVGFAGLVCMSRTFSRRLSQHGRYLGRTARRSICHGRYRKNLRYCHGCYYHWHAVRRPEYDGPEQQFPRYFQGGDDDACSYY